MAFKPVEQKIDFPALERRILDWWYKSGIVKKYLHKNDKAKKRFSFIDGPLTANSPMGAHHAWGRTLKDFFQRYKNMQGYRQRFQNGFDCQGLWVEVEVEKEAGFNSKKDIEKFGIDNFTNACKARVKKFSQIQTEQSKRLGMFMDWENSYFTNSETNNLYIWRFLKIVNEKGWLYKDKSSATWCPRCETGLSQHEQADGYKDISDTSVYLKFKLKDRKNEYLLAWTTTPWTLSANVLLAINTKFDYVKVKVNGEAWFLAEKSAKSLGFKDTEKIDGKSLIGLEYESLYDISAQKGVEHKVVEWDLVDPAEGTGVVHVAPGCGQEDYELGKKLKAAMISPLDQTGHFTDGFGDLSGRDTHEVGENVIEWLKKRRVLFKTETVHHRYPHCWRCGTKCLFRLEDDWFINCKELKPLLKKLAAEANWIPEFAGKRMQNWLDNMGDWMISRKRYYGLALPFYECRCGEFVVVGSKEELRSLAIDKKKVDELPSLHRPWIDEVLIKCPKCGQPIKRIADVGDCWLDAGVVPFSTLKYFEDKSYWQKWFPAEFICEMVEQVRLWYYSMLVYGAVFEKKVPYLNVLNYVEVRDEKGERMSKTKKTSIPLEEAAEKMGVDVMRWLYLHQNTSSNLNFGLGTGDEVRRKFHLMIWNIYNFFVTYANIDKWQEGSDPHKSPNVLDKWIMSRLNQLVKTVTNCLDNYDAANASQAIEEFVADLSTWYVRRSRDRIGPTAENGDDKDFCYATLHEVLAGLCRLLAPFTPFMAEEMYQNLTGEESVHLADWPKVGKIDKKIEENMDMVRKICELGHAARKIVGIKVRQPLFQFSIFNFPAFAKATAGKQFSINNELVQLVKDELNIKQVVFKSGKGEIKVKLDTKITPELKAEGEVRDLTRQIQELRKKSNCRLNQKIRAYGSKWPTKEDLRDYIKKETLADDLLPGKELQIEPVE